jgi:hypothetical protein
MASPATVGRYDEPARFGPGGVVGQVSLGFNIANSSPGTVRFDTTSLRSYCLGRQHAPRPDTLPERGALERLQMPEECRPLHFLGRLVGLDETEKQA